MTNDCDVFSMCGVLVSDIEVLEWIINNISGQMTDDEYEAARTKAVYEISTARNLETDGNQ